MHLHQMVNVILVAILAHFYDFVDGGCPSPQLLHPCVCEKSRSVLMCKDLDNENALKYVVKVAKGSGIEGIEFVSTALRYIPEDAFEGLHIKFLSIRNSSILALSETTRAFLGLEKSLKSLVVEGCPFANAWEWYQLANLTKLEELEVVESELLELGPDFLTLSKLPILKLKFIGTSLHVISKDAFSSFKDLNTMSLEKNELIEVQRTMFPRPAKKLASLDLSFNHIRFLPDDMFIDMPALKFLYLSSNPLHILEEKTFKIIWNQLSMFALHDAPLVCDCRLQWLTKVKNNKFRWWWRKEKKITFASCVNPIRLNGRVITTLEEQELWCSMLSREPEIP